MCRWCLHQSTVTMECVARWHVALADLGSFELVMRLHRGCELGARDRADTRRNAVDEQVRMSSRPLLLAPLSDGRSGRTRLAGPSKLQVDVERRAQPDRQCVVARACRRGRCIEAGALIRRAAVLGTARLRVPARRRPSLRTAVSASHQDRDLLHAAVPNGALVFDVPAVG